MTVMTYSAGGRAAATLDATPRLPRTATRRRRLLLAPVTISPTKPLTPTHVKYLLSLDLLRRATACFADVSVLYDHAAFAGSRQVSGFWAYLNGRGAQYQWDALTEQQIGELYVDYHRDAAQVDPAALAEATERAEAGWIHPATARLLDLWEQHYQRLGLYDPALGRTGPPPAPAAEILDLLKSRGLCIDVGVPGAPVYLDATEYGLPLRMIVSADGRANYLLYLLRQLIPQLGSHDLVVLAHDAELRTDYQVVTHVLTALGADVRRYEVPRVPVDGVVRSARYGGWDGLTVPELADPLVAEYGADAFRLGARLYLIAELGRTARQSFSEQHLRRWTTRAERLLDTHAVGAAPPAPGERETVAGYLAGLAGPRGYADPYLVATRIMTRNPAVPVPGLLRLATGRDGGPAR